MDEFERYRPYFQSEEDDADYEPLDELSEWGWVGYSLIAGVGIIAIVAMSVSIFLQVI